MTIKDLDTETLNLLNKLCDNWYTNQTWLTYCMDNYCRDCQLMELCHMLGCYYDDIRKELALRKQE